MWQPCMESEVEGRNPGKQDKEGKSESGERMMEGGELLWMGVVICHSQSKRRKGDFRVCDVSPEEFHCFSVQTDKKWIKQGDTPKPQKSRRRRRLCSRRTQKSSPGTQEILLSHGPIPEVVKFTCASRTEEEPHFLSGSENILHCFRIDYSRT